MDTVTLHYDRDGNAKSTGDARFTLDPDASEGVDEREHGGFVAVLPDGTNLPIRANVYRPDGGDREEGYTLELDAGEVHVAEATSSEGTASAANPLVAMAKAGDVDGLAAWYEANVEGIGEKLARKNAEKMIEKHS